MKNEKLAPSVTLRTPGHARSLSNGSISSGHCLDFVESLVLPLSAVDTTVSRTPGGLNGADDTGSIASPQQDGADHSAEINSSVNTNSSADVLPNKSNKSTMGRVRDILENNISALLLAMGVVALVGVAGVAVGMIKLSALKVAAKVCAATVVVTLFVRHILKPVYDNYIKRAFSALKQSVSSSCSVCYSKIFSPVSSDKMQNAAPVAATKVAPSDSTTSLSATHDSPPVDVTPKV